MIPSVVARQLRQGLADYVETTFPFANEPFRSSFKDFVEADKNLCLEPYTAIRLPFRSCASMPTCFDAVMPEYLPYEHQQQAFDRLVGDDGRSTLVATGTGSGKTECFLYPIIDYCYRHRGESGIKAIIVYPMNALATDQAGRIAKLIYGNSKLRDNVIAGLYVGGLMWSEGVKVMTEDSVITDHETMIAHPPDILLTNYKMLDYLLMRPHDAQIWARNNPDTLKYVAVDEMHTFDGAQGTDLACLIRRLKARLYIQPGHLCCIGTSATMGGESAKEGMLKYAHDLFGEPFDKDAVVQESRQTVEEFLGGVEPQYYSLPDAYQVEELRTAIVENDYRRYMAVALESFFEGAIESDPFDFEARIKLAAKLKECSLFQSVMEQFGGKYYQASEVIEVLGNKHPELAGGDGDVILDALTALVSYARTGSADKPRPFLNVQVQLWGKELRRLVADVAKDHVDFDIAINLSAEYRDKFLPVINCRDCGQTAWAGITTQDQHIRIRSLDAFYNTYFGSGENLIALYPREPGEEAPGNCIAGWYCPECGKFRIDNDNPPKLKWACSDCGADAVAVSLSELDLSARAGSGKMRSRQYRCPSCASEQGLSLMGLQGTTESEVTLTQLFATGFDEDARTLVFSDNVQDASHRAGFFNGRTWKFGLRAAMQEYLHATGGRQTVAEFTRGFADYWVSHMAEEEFVARFIAPNNIWMREYEKLIDEGRLSGTSETAKLLQSIKNRMAYEALLELGMRSHIGRTMEKSGAIAVEYDSGKVGLAARAASELLRNEQGLHDVDEASLETLVVALLQKLRSQGAFAEPVYEDYIAQGARTYILSHRNKVFMPGLHASGIPQFPIVSEMKRTRFTTSYTPEFVAIAQKALPEHCELNAGLAAEIIRCVKRACASVGLLVKIAEGSNYCSYAISEASAYVTSDAVRFTCDTCGQSIVRARANFAQFEGSPCPSTHCSGHVHESQHQGLDYYGELFASGLHDRIFAREHTGLLRRTDREEVEREFKANGADRRPWYPNVLSCTPTLEMGIDIGGLSSLVMCGMPPGQAQFLQRAGRAGRRDGNALAVVFANANPHGMYFYGDPREMLEGNVEAPRVFLEASAVLERQFTAYCLDRWIKEVKDEKCIPQNMFKCLQVVREPTRDESKFPFNFFIYVKARTNQLVNSFLQMFSGDFSSDSDVAQSLRLFASGGSGSETSRLHVRIYDAFYNRMRLREFYKDQKAVIGKIIEELKSHPQDSSFDEKIKDHEIEKRAIDNVIKSINNENVFGFLSREGLLPNYAFPEEGANLRVVLRRKSENEGEGARWERETQEFSRSAASAISEFAPGNTFYANGRHYEVDQIDLSSAKEEDWRLCPDCSHAELITPDTPSAACPKCHSTGWADKAQRRKMLKLSTVVSNGDYSETMSDDSSDRRTVEFFSRQLLVEVDKDKDVVRAYKVKSDDIDFGFEYVRKAKLREINYGRANAGTAHESSIAGQTYARTGFKVCMKCGKVQKEGEGPDHTRFCHVSRNLISHEEAVEECLFLYREFETEAVRMLIPETSAVDIADGIVESFKAAVMLGLRKKYGNVDHLSMTVSEEPVPESGFRKRYLVIYDSVPGGTGYLKQLLRDDREFLSVLQMSLDAMEGCSCKDDPHKDGCYRCLYVYRQSHNIGSISRAKALEVLHAILAAERVETVSCLDDVDVNNLFDSALEKMFVDALSGAVGPDGKAVKCDREVVNGKPGYSIRVGQHVWEVEPQVDLDSSRGVSIKCRPDFVLWPVGFGKEDARKPIAVFTDGFEYHKARVADDVLKRESICRSGVFRVWSLSYKDVEHAIKGTHGDYYLDVLRIPELPNEAFYERGIVNAPSRFEPDKETPFSSLIWYLGHDDAEEVFELHANAYSLAMIGMMTPGTPEAQETSKQCEELADAMQLAAGKTAEDFAFVGFWRPGEGEHLSVITAATKEDVQGFKGTYVFAVLDDSDPDDVAFQPQWNGCLDLYNLMQFFWEFAFVPKSGLDKGCFNKLPAKVRLIGGESFTGGARLDEAWASVLEDMLDREYGEKLMEAGIPAPDEVGFELETGEQAELAWFDRRICFLTDDLLDDADAFTSAGWRVFHAGVDIDAVTEMFEVNR